MENRSKEEEEKKNTQLVMPAHTYDALVSSSSTYVR